MINYDKKAKKIIGDSMKRFANEKGLSEVDVQILVSAKPTGEPKYKKMIKYTPESDITVDDIYQIKFDIGGVKNIITMFIAKALQRIAEDSKKPLTEINVIMYQLDEKRGVELYAYHNTEKIAPLSWGYVFGEEAMLNLVENESNIN